MRPRFARARTCQARPKPQTRNPKPQTPNSQTRTLFVLRFGFAACRSRHAALVCLLLCTSSAAVPAPAATAGTAREALSRRASLSTARSKRSSLEYSNYPKPRQQSCNLPPPGGVWKCFRSSVFAQLSAKLGILGLLCVTMGLSWASLGFLGDSLGLPGAQAARQLARAGGSYRWLAQVARAGDSHRWLAQVARTGGSHRWLARAGVSRR